MIHGFQLTADVSEWASCGYRLNRITEITYGDERKVQNIGNYVFQFFFVFVKGISISLMRKKKSKNVRISL